MFTPYPPYDDDVRLLADALWRYSHSSHEKYRISVQFVSLQNVIAKSTTCIEYQYSNRFHYQPGEPSEEFLTAALYKLKCQPFSIKITEYYSAGALLIAVNGKQFKQSPQEQLLFSSPFQSDFVFKIDKMTEYDGAITGTQFVRYGFVSLVEKYFCKLEISGGASRTGEPNENGFTMLQRFAEIVVKCKDFASFQERECLQTAKDVLSTVKMLIGEFE